MNNLSELAENFKKNGIKSAFGITGSGLSLKLITELEKFGIEYYPVAHEASAAIMSGAFGNGKLESLGISIKGPGFINMAPGILLNYFEGRPSLTISESYNSGENELYHKKIDHYSIIKSITKVYAKFGINSNSLSKLFNISEEEFPGPVHIDMAGKPEDSFIVNNELDYSNFQDCLINENAVYDIIQKSQKPVLIIGSLFLRKFNIELIKDLKIPILVTAAAKGIIDETSDYYGGIITGEGKKISPEEMIVKNADLVISIGLRKTEIIKSGFIENIKLINFDKINSSFSNFKNGITFTSSNLDKVLNDVSKMLNDKKWGLDNVKKYWNDVYKILLDQKEDWTVINAINYFYNKLSPSYSLVLDTGLFCTICEIFWKVKTFKNFLGSSISRFMGTAIPTAIGYSLKDKSNKILCVFGDGGIRPYISEIKLAKEYKLPIVFLLLSDGSYGTIASAIQPDMNMYRQAYTISDYSWWKSIKELGIAAYRINKFESLDDLLKYMIDISEPVFIEAYFNPEKYSKSTLNFR